MDQLYGKGQRGSPKSQSLDNIGRIWSWRRFEQSKLKVRQNDKNRCRGLELSSPVSQSIHNLGSRKF